MHETASQVAIVGLIFLVAGGVKGVAGMGLPTIGIGLLGLSMSPAKAAALIVVPSLVTNVWQYASGPHRAALLRRTSRMLVGIAIVTCAAAGLMTRPHSEQAVLALGAALAAYAIVGLARVSISVRRKQEPWLAPLIGGATGLVTGATGVFVLPAVPYLQALGLEQDELVQALGLSFTVSTIALAAGLAAHGAFRLEAIGASIACVAPALGGMVLGQTIRSRIDPSTFRRIFFIGLLALGLDLVARALP